ncbi:F0F1 ATP synthase subunit A [Nonomuraea sp. bgisy101]|uniref:F0F1 ATP synthase subunit A n=1 Tax=Nonomuraea sp. bgisy101 TaxID=3413784 RepID=UPI003D7655B8
MSDRFTPPGPELFQLPPLFRDGPAWLTKPVLIAVLTALLLIAFFWSAFANPKIVPRGIQNLAELGYVFVRDHVARPFLGRHTDRWMGLLLTIFFTALVWNVMGVVPLIQYPIAANIAFPLVLAFTVYFVKIYQAVKHHGWSGYLGALLFPKDLPRWAIGLYAPLMFMENFLNSLFTHFVRLFANMFAGHLILAFFSSVGFWFLFERLTPLGSLVGLVGVAMTILMTAFELFIMFLQAFLFTLLAAMFVGDAIEGNH